ncbi:glycerol dehydrogenase [Pseudoflavonifractor sp. MSJ-37]|uniref:glycerol dehydrogenase n=1 Tax=Pseudoflavonifractor sp. MSJ-37 TaxID=2841531 RepID=UPI001C1278F5|nr:glycerol dehydrogenase [Pseudoflavonifractor sp. MSJ-37]MBU5434251.1 glycerol dehydrogenase [Pseudoflavonifractor sp. MSJ-37]
MSIGIKAPGKYTQGAGELSKLGLNVKKMGSKFFLLCTANTRKRVGETIEESLKSVEKDYVFCDFHGECSKAEISRVMDLFQENGCDVMVGIGGGKVIDTAKAAAENLGGKPVVIIPTVASNDAPCSGVAVIYNEEGVVIKALLTKRNPDLVLVDTSVIAKAPARLLVAGMGDALATWFETRACKRSGAKSMARGVCSNTAYMMSKLCYDLLIQNGAAALEALKKGESDPALENVVEANIYLSGIGFESGGLAAAHAINDGFAYVPAAHGMYHGEKVAYGLLCQLILEGAPQEEFDEVSRFCRTVGLPTKLADLGITEVKDEEIRKVAEAACVPTQSTKNVRADITPDEVYAAILKVDELGRR